MIYKVGGESPDVEEDNSDSSKGAKLAIFSMVVLHFQVVGVYLLVS